MENSTIATLILAYISNIFIARFLNKILYENANLGIYKYPAVWFVPVIPIVVYIYILLLYFLIRIRFNNNKMSYWFFGKNWDKNQKR